MTSSHSADSGLGSLDGTADEDENNLPKARSKIPQRNPNASPPLSVAEKLAAVEAEAKAAKETRKEEVTHKRKANPKTSRKTSRRRSTLSPEELASLMGVRWVTAYFKLLRLSPAQAECFSFTNTIRYRAFPASISTIARLASFIGTLLFQVRTPFFANKSNICRISLGEPIDDPPIFADFAMSANALKPGITSSGAPTWMNDPSTLNSCRYCAKGIFGDDTVHTIRSRLEACLAAQSLSSSVAIKSSAPIRNASSFFDADLEIATTLSQPNAFAPRTPKCPRPPRPTMPTFLPGPAPFRKRGETAVIPPQSIGAATSEGNASGILKTEMRVAPPVIGIPAHRFAAVLVLGVVRCNVALLAVLLESVCALFAVTLKAGSWLRTNSNTAGERQCYGLCWKLELTDRRFWCRLRLSSPPSRRCRLSRGLRTLDTDSVPIQIEACASQTRKCRSGWFWYRHHSLRRVSGS